MRIWHVNTEDVGGGAARVAMSLAQAQAARGHDVSLIVGRRSSGERFVTELPGDAARGRWARALHGAAARLKSANGKVPGTWRLGAACDWLAEPGRQRAIARGAEDFDYPGTRRLLDRVRDADDRPDVLHLHNLHGGYFDLRLLPELSHAVPTVVTLHDAWLFSGHCAHGLGCDRWVTGCGSCPDLSIYPVVRRDDTAMNWQRKRDILGRSRLYVTAPARELMDKFDRSIAKAGAVDARVIYHGIDTGVFTPGSRVAARRAVGLEGDEPVLLFAARGIRRSVWKDYATLRDAVATVAKRLGRGVRFVALGEDGPDETIGEARVRFVPFERDPARVAEYYRAADAYIHAAKQEVWGLTITEAMACGCPVVATAVGGIPEQVVDGRTGFLIPVGDAGAMADAIARLLDGPALRRRLADEAAAHVRGWLTLDRQVDDYLDWYSHAVSPRSHSGAKADSGDREGRGNGGSRGGRGFARAA